MAGEWKKISTVAGAAGVLMALPLLSATAVVGLFNSAVGFVLLLLANLVARKVSSTSLF